MTMTPITPLHVSVRCGWFDGRPRSIRLADEQVPVLAVTRVREESAAYPAARGPRTLFELETPDARLALAFEHRSRRWVLEALDPDAREAFPRAA